MAGVELPCNTYSSPSDGSMASFAASCDTYSVTDGGTYPNAVAQPDDSVTGRPLQYTWNHSHAHAHA